MPASDPDRAGDLLYRLVVDSTMEGVWIIDAEGRTTFANRQMAEMLGCEPEDLIGASVFDFMDEAGRRETEKNMDRRRGGVAERHLFRFLRKNGEDLWAELAANPLWDDDGRFLGALAMVRDVTRERAAEELLRRSEQSMAEAQALAHVGSFEWEIGPDRVTWSEELYRIYGVPPGTPMTYAGYLAHVHPDDRRRVQASVEATRAGGPPYDHEYRIHRPDGALRTVIGRGQARLDAQGRVESVVGICQDVTDSRRAEAEQRRMQERLEVVERLASIGTLAAGVAHEINNPLAYTVANLDLAHEILTSRTAHSQRELDELQQMIDDAQDGARRVARIVATLKVMTRAEPEEPLRELALPALLDTATQVSAHEIRHRARLLKDYGPAPTLLGDEAGLVQVFVNLLVNAAQAIPPGDPEHHHIRLTTGTDARGWAVAAIEDTGEGIATQHLARLFEPFFTTKPVGEGSGLGLPICHGIVSAHGGEITVDSQPGRGSTFRVALPPAPPPAQ